MAIWEIAQVDPTVNDDFAAGYEKGKLWLNEADDKSFVSLDSTNGAAIWKQFAPSGDGSHFHDGDTLQCDGINSDGGAFAFTTGAAVTFSQDVNVPNLFLPDGGAIGIEGNELLTFAAAGTVTLSGANFVVGTNSIYGTDGRYNYLSIDGADDGAWGAGGSIWVQIDANNDSADATFTVKAGDRPGRAAFSPMLDAERPVEGIPHDVYVVEK